MKFKDKIFLWIFGVNPARFRSHRGLSEITHSDLDDNYLFDFLNYSSGTSRNTIQLNGSLTVTGSETIESFQDQIATGTRLISTENTPKQIAIKPKDVLHELERVPKEFDLLGIDQKVSILQDKAKLITQSYAKREVNGLIERLQLRKKYAEFSSFFGKFDNTDDEKIDALLKKHDLVMKPSDIFIPDFPDDAVEIMKEYTEQMDKLCGKKPVFYVIATHDKFKEQFKRNDPILLVQSPFGFYWQILGAWDEEMLILSEL